MGNLRGGHHAVQNASRFMDLTRAPRAQGMMVWLDVRLKLKG